MTTQTVEEQITQALLPPQELSKEEKWIVRIHGKDLGPFSSRQLYPKLLQGDIEPESLLLDQEHFSRARLREIPEFQPYIHLHNTYNPILLEEKRRQEKDRQWEETGRKRAILLSVSSFMLVVLGVAAFFVLRKSDDAYLTDGDHVFQLGGSFQGFSEKKTKDWDAEERKRLSMLRKTRKSSGASKPKAQQRKQQASARLLLTFAMMLRGGGIPTRRDPEHPQRKIFAALFIVSKAKWNETVGLMVAPFNSQSTVQMEKLPPFPSQIPIMLRVFLQAAFAVLRMDGASPSFPLPQSSLFLSRSNAGHVGERFFDEETYLFV